jgi:alpha-tubulin suppressor-like RCC1 family protein
LVRWGLIAILIASCSTSVGGANAASAPICIVDNTQCSGVVFQECAPDGSRWVTRAQCTPGVTRCERGVGCVPDCTPGQTRCLDRDRYQVCFDNGRGPVWGEPRMCNLSAREQCSTDTNRCSQVIDACSREGSLSCDMSGNVYRCVNRGGVRVLEMVLNCRSQGFPGCLSLESGASLDACVNACGGRGVRLNANPGDRVPGSVCAQYECAESRLTVHPNRNDCRPVGEACSSGRQCASGRCLTDGRCGALGAPEPPTCAHGMADCDGNSSNDCEVDTRSNTDHCGGCGMHCAASTNAEAACAEGRCAYRCNVGFGDCDGDPANGCEADLSSRAHCGRCGNACSQGTTCRAGVCDSVVQIAAGGGYTCARRTTGAVLCWGANSVGQLGDGTRERRLTPTPVNLIGNAVEISVGVNATSCARLSSGAVSCWGSNDFGQLGNGGFAGSLLAQAVGGLPQAVEVTNGGGRHTCARLTTGAVACWGENDFGQVGNGRLGTSPVELQTRPALAVGLIDAVEVSAGLGHTCALRSSGRVVCWGGNYGGQIGDGSLNTRPTPFEVARVTNAVEVTTGQRLSCARLADLTVVCWGDGVGGRLGDGTGASRLTATQVLGATDVLEIDAGVDHVCARRRNGTVLCWGTNTDGQLGDGTTTTRFAPVSVRGLTDAVEISVGANHSCARLASGLVVCWGGNAEGQLGDGTTITRLTLVTVSGVP